MIMVSIIVLAVCTLLCLTICSRHYYMLTTYDNEEYIIPNQPL